MHVLEDVMLDQTSVLYRLFCLDVHVDFIKKTFLIIIIMHSFEFKICGHLGFIFVSSISIVIF